MHTMYILVVHKCTLCYYKCSKIHLTSRDVLSQHILNRYNVKCIVSLKKGQPSTQTVFGLITHSILSRVGNERLPDKPRDLKSPPVNKN